MNTKRIIETSILKTSLNFQLLDYLEELIENDNTEAISIVNGFFNQRKKFTYKEAAPLICLETTLGMLASVIFFAKSKNITLSQKTKDNIKNHLNRKDEEILRIIRNAIAHWSDDEYKNILFHEDEIEFISHKKSVSMQLPEGLHYFVMDVIRETRLNMK